MASLGEETRASCRGPSNHNAVALILPHKSMLGFDGGAIGADIYCDRSGIHCRTIGDCAKVLDALKDPVEGYYDPRDVCTTVPRSSVLSTPYANHAQASGMPGALKGIRLGIIRESMVYPPGSKTEEPIVTAAAKEIKTVLGDRLGATLVESSDPLVATRDPDIELMKTDFRSRAGAAGAGVHARSAVPAGDATDSPFSRSSPRRSCRPSSCPEKCSAAAPCGRSTIASSWRRGGSRRPSNLDLATIQQQELAMAFRFHIPQYLTRRAADWKALGFTETLVDFAALNARSKFWGDDQRAAFKNWEEVTDPRNPHGQRQGVNERIMLRELLRRVDMMVILENHLDALVRLHTPLPPGLIGGAYQYDIVSNLRPESFSGPNAGLTEVLIPAGYVTTVYDPVFALSEDGTRYVSDPVRTRRPPFRSPACRSRWCFGPSPARRTSS